MKYTIRGANLELTEALKDYVQKKLNRLERYFEAPPTSDVSVTLSVVRDLQNVEVTIPLPGVLLRAEVKGNDMYASIDLVTEKLERQIRKHKTKANRKIRQVSGMRTFKEEANIPQMHEEDEEFELVRTKRFTLKPMNVDEAILQMNLVGHSFFVFSNADASEEVNVVYRRNDGTYGLIEPAR
ncbi:ribosome-associated translation inhibitor RaiA [Gorillibacterium sp. CAU 1737]|uniref:ribosome hibernation-promoting factor, HPF/YfiA family n=1 Tax=Gorillibacterium sp. CAU 1737 TaxID=3140362 RepID=UPI003260DFD8